jgi:hypothetical protein
MDERDTHEEAETQYYFMDNFITMSKTFISFILFLEVSSTKVCGAINKELRQLKTTIANSKCGIII